MPVIPPPITATSYVSSPASAGYRGVGGAVSDHNEFV